MSGTINFKYFPASTWRPSGFYAEFDASQANTAVQNLTGLLVGQMLAAGTATANAPLLATSQAQVNLLCGANSMLAMMYAAYRLQDPYGECWLLPVADNGAGAAAIGSVLFAGTATANGTLSLYVGGTLLSVGVNAGDTAASIATNVAAAVNAAAGLACTATAATATVTLTARHKGLAQNDTDLRLNYRALRGGEATPPGITATVTAFAGGTLNPVLTGAFANLGGTQAFDFIALPYTDAASLAAANALLSDQTGRWSAIAMLYGHVFAAFRGTVSARGTFGTGLNSQHMSILGYFNSPTPAWLEAADWTGAHAAIIRTNPALGVVDQPLGLLAPPVGDDDEPGERNVMLHDGVSTFRVDATGQCVIDRSISTYQLNPSGAPDDSYLNTNLLFQAAYAARYIRSQITSQYTNKILVDDGAAIGPGSPATTPSLVFQAAVGIYGYLATQFIVQNVDSFARNGYGRKGSKGQVLLYLPIDFSDQVIQVAALIQFRQST